MASKKDCNSLDSEQEKSKNEGGSLIDLKNKKIVKISFAEIILKEGYFIRQLQERKNF